MNALPPRRDPAPRTPGAHRSRLRQMLAALWNEHASPARLGLAVGVGVLVGCSPLYGLQTGLGLALAFALRLNKLAVVLGTQISIPPLAPLLAFGSIQLGALLHSGAPLTLDRSALAWRELPRLVGRYALLWAIGGAVVGLALGAAAGLLTFAMARARLRRHADRQP